MEQVINRYLQSRLARTMRSEIDRISFGSANEQFEHFLIIAESIEERSVMRTESLPQANFKTLKGNQVSIEDDRVQQLSSCDCRIVFLYMYAIVQIMSTFFSKGAGN